MFISNDYTYMDKCPSQPWEWPKSLWWDIDRPTDTEVFRLGNDGVLYVVCWH